MARRVSRKIEHRRLLDSHRKEYDALLAFQGGGCAICSKPPGTRRHALDHDHKTMKLRGILCTACNMRLTDRSSADWLARAYVYVTNPPYQEFING